MRPAADCGVSRKAVRAWLRRLEQFSELRDARNGTPHHSILCCAALQVRPAQCFALALLAKKTLRLFVKCSKGNGSCSFEVTKKDPPKMGL
ncbi:hypothetical protein DVJ83_11290 [Deinococcus wulumuqiensis]|uniref:Uncharacterized protein n=1 Tax=Deinococcus wulumuqiensis TaxID=980427 RepID=A0A345IKD4_9DEIO|nr:hypothetical protein DVJ83_11290 [Deinococcus wulumuqiensis]